MAEGIAYAGEFDISSLKLYTATGEIIDLSAVYQELDIYENMFSNALTGTIQILDTNNLTMNAPITGQEFLSFKINTPGLDNVPIDFTNHVMSIYKIDLRVSDRGSELIILHFCSPELLRNNRTRLSKVFEGNISDTVVEILKGAKALNTEKELFVEHTLGIKKTIVPNKNPYSLIRDLTTDAISMDGSPHFVFFENLDGIHFRTLDSLYEQGSVGEFIASDKGDIDFAEGGISNVEEDLKRVLEYSFASNNDTKRNIKSGMFGSKAIRHNIYLKNYRVIPYDYFDEFNKHKRVCNNTSTDNPIYNDGAVDFANNLSDFKDAKIFMHGTSEDSAGTDTQHYGGAYTPNKILNNISSRYAKNTEIDNGVKINMQINGNTTVRTGSVIDFQLPIVGTNHTGDDFDVYHSGKFLITKANHHFVSLGKKYTIHLSAVKDSFNSKLPSGFGESQEPRGGQL